jgi:hypothetical protein
MAYFAVYVFARGEPRDGDNLASGTGWLGWANWAAGKTDRYPEAAHLAEEGWLEPAAALDELEHELEQLLHEKAGRNVHAVTAALLAAVKHRPGGCIGLIVSDGTPGPGEDDEDEPGGA